MGGANHPAIRRYTQKVDAFRLIADRKIEEAMEEGAFDQLAGAGRPLDLEEDPLVDPALRMAHRLLKNNGFAPWWVEEGKDIETAIAALQGDFTQGRIGAEAFRERARALNCRILSFNLQAPPSAHKLPLAGGLG